MKKTKKNNLNYTSLEQSRWLLYFGLDPETADMKYPWVYEDVKGEFKQHYKKYPCDMHENYADFIPCWSVGALIKLLPSSIVDKKGTKYIKYSDFEHVEYLAGYWDHGYHYKAFSEFTHDQTLVDVLYKCVEWLLENNYIKSKVSDKQKTKK